MAEIKKHAKKRTLGTLSDQGNSQTEKSSSGSGSCSELSAKESGVRQQNRTENKNSAGVQNSIDNENVTSDTELSLKPGYQNRNQHALGTPREPSPCKDTEPSPNMIAFPEKRPANANGDGLTTKVCKIKNIRKSSSGKWRVDIEYQGAMRYFGLFKTRGQAELACAIITKELQTTNDTKLAMTTTKENISSAKEAALRAISEERHELRGRCTEEATWLGDLHCNVAIEKRKSSRAKKASCMIGSPKSATKLTGGVGGTPSAAAKKGMKVPPSTANAGPQRPPILRGREGDGEGIDAKVAAAVASLTSSSDEEADRVCGVDRDREDVCGVGRIGPLSPAEHVAALLSLDVDASSTSSSIDDDTREKIIQFKRIFDPMSYPEGEVKRARRCLANSELRRLRNHLPSGLHDIAPNNAAGTSIRIKVEEVDDVSVASDNVVSRPRRLANVGDGSNVETRHWNEDVASDGGRSGGIVADRPIHYNVVPNSVTSITNGLRVELLGRFWGRKNDCVRVKDSGRLASPEQVFPGYFKAHIIDDVGNQLRSLDILPGHLEVKEKARQKVMMFLNTKDGTSDCHFDRDSSALYVVSGHKEVKIAPPLPDRERPALGILDDVNPFSKSRVHHGRFRWETINLAPGCVLYIPKFWIHCIRSIGRPNTLALSFQVKQSVNINPNRKMWEPMEVPFMLPDVSPGVPFACAATEPQSNITSDNNGLLIIPREPRTPMGPSCRTSGRQKYKCGICSKRGFNGDEMWILFWPGDETIPPGLPECPVTIPQHLVCLECCPRDRGSGERGGERKVSPAEVIRFPHGSSRPILTEDEFRQWGNIDGKYFKKYVYCIGSEIDYKTKIVYHGQPINATMYG